MFQDYQETEAHLEENFFFSSFRFVIFIEYNLTFILAPQTIGYKIDHTNEFQWKLFQLWLQN